ncbi:hypothetical protein N7492_006290 [Penicillium capsulatum]|uniref:Uncharacterized protein n=1 Tax=Penicillium capsulatum TaxID=69766 RepID=A0A9W9I3T3_9EURO|nr:hypothetical protein N7492_006290 [Penicillium capsulatum]KAJ6108941.1 hypothetical protein N7512_008778 [Penicillium capsulatum]
MSSPGSTPAKRKTPVKRESAVKLLGMTDTEPRALCFGSICTTEKIRVDYDKLAAMLNITRKSASNQYSAARHKLDKAIKAETGMDPEDVMADGSPTKKPKVSKARTPRATKSTTRKGTKASPVKADGQDESEDECNLVKTDGTEVTAQMNTDLNDPLGLLDAYNKGIVDECPAF